MPVFPVNPGGPQLPLEGSPYPAVSAFREEVGTNQSRTLGMEMIQDATRWAEEPFVPQTWVQHDDAVAALKKQGYDTSDVPQNGMNGGALLERMNRASKLRQTEDDARRANLGVVSGTTAALAGGLGDPLNVVLAPLGGYGAAAVRAGVGARVALGAAEGAVFAGGNAEASAAYGKSQHYGDPDLTSADLMKTMLVGAATGGILNGAFGPRPVAGPGGGPVTLDMIDKLGERTAAYSKRTGIPIDEAVSPAGAVGRYQIMPSTALQYGATKEQIAAGLLRDPTFNKNIAQKIIDDLNAKFPNDPEAVAIAYNAGPGAARRFIRSGRDWSVLPAETRAYAARVAGMPVQARTQAASTAMSQATQDAAVDVQPAIDSAVRDTYKTNPFKIADEHADDVRRIETEAMQNVTKPDSLFTEDPEAAARLQQMEQVVPPEKPAQTTEAAIDPELAAHVTQDVQDAKAIAANLGDEKAAFEEPEPLMIDGMPAEDHQKAVEAALKCGLLKGGL